MTPAIAPQSTPSRRLAASTVKMSPASLVQSFALTAERYREVVRNLGKHVTNSEHSTAEREQVRAMLGGHGIVFSRDGRMAASEHASIGSDWPKYIKPLQINRG